MPFLRRRTARVCPLRAACAALCLPLLAFAQDPDDPELVLRRYDVRALEAAYLPVLEEVDNRPIGRASRLDQLETDGEFVPERGGGWVADRFGPFVWNLTGSPGLSIEFAAGFLEVEATEATHAEVRAALDAVEVFARRSLLVEILALPSEEANAVAPVLRSGEVEELLSRVAPLGYARATTRPGVRAHLGSRDVRALLYDYDVEVNTFATFADPAVTIARTGYAFSVLVDPEVDGELYVRAWGRDHRDAGEPRLHPIGAGGDAPVQLARWYSYELAGSACLGDGGAFVLSCSEPPGCSWLIRVRRERPWEPTDAVSLGSACAPSFANLPDQLHGPVPSGGWFGSGFLDDLGTEFWEAPPGEERDLLERLALDGPDVRLTRWGEVAVAAGAPGAEWLRGQVAAWEAARGPTVGLELRHGFLDPALGARIARGELGAVELTTLLTERAVGACRSGDVVTVSGSIERPYVHDYDIEFSQGIHGTDPAVAVLRHGMAFWCRPVLDDAGRCALWTSLQIARPLHGDQIDITTHLGGRFPDGEELPDVREHLELPRSAVASVRQTFITPPGEPVLLYCGNLAGTDRLLIASLTPTVYP